MGIYQRALKKSAIKKSSFKLSCSYELDIDVPDTITVNDEEFSPEVDFNGNILYRGNDKDKVWEIKIFITTQSVKNEQYPFIIQGFYDDYKVFEKTAGQKDVAFYLKECCHAIWVNFEED